MGLMRFFAVLIFFSAGVLAAQAAEMRVWTDNAGQTVKAQYLECTDETVTIRLANLQNLQVKLSDLSAADLEYVAEQRAKEIAANQISPYIVGEIVWRLPDWSSLSWYTTQKAEVWSWDEELEQPKEKLAVVDVEYTHNYRGARDQFEASFRTAQPITISKNDRLIVKAPFRVSVNGRNKVLEDSSKPITLPQVNRDNELKLPTVRAMVRR